MKTNESTISLKGSINMSIKPTDPVAWKLLMLYEAASNKADKITSIAKKYGYTREHFYVIKKKFDESGSEGLRDKPRGPKRNYKRTKELEKQIIRHRFLDPEASCEVITQKLRQAGHNISQRSVERTINVYGLQKKGYIKQIRKTRKLK
ncbi:MAG: helix-turn-helix domain-containing protein [Bacteroidales bacterium]